LEQVALNSTNSLARHDLPVRASKGFLERELVFGEHLNILAKGVGVALLDTDGAAHLGSVLPVDLHLQKRLAIELDRAEVLIEPYDDVLGRAGGGKCTEPFQRFEKSLAPGDDHMDEHIAAGVPQHAQRIVLQQIVRK